ncbi:unnamed protein product, partial [Ixodes pacificus]
LAQLLSAAPYLASKADFASAGMSYSNWVSDPAYMGLIAAIDMFLYRFPNHQYASARVGTMPSRYKDCSVFTALGQIVSLTGVPISALYRWMIVREVADEAVQLMRPMEELSKEFSYSPYMADLRLVTKSPYSAVSNQLVHQWLHTVGSLLLSERSLNARHLSDNNFNQILASAAVLAFVRHRATGFVMSFVSSKEKAKAEGELLAKLETAATITGISTSIIAADWFAWLAERGFVVPHFIYHFYRSMSGVTRLRDGSVGKKV